MAPRRSTRLHPQIHTSEECAGIAPRRSLRLHSRIQSSQDGAGVPCRRHHPQIDASEEGAGVTHRIRRPRRTSPATAASLPDGDDMLREILLRLPPQPSSLPDASAVCKRWRGLVTDLKFHRQFYAHHGKPPLLGVFERRQYNGNPFRSILDTPDIPPERFGLPCQIGTIAGLLGCRHGRVLLIDLLRLKSVQLKWCPIIWIDALTCLNGSTGEGMSAASRVGNVDMLSEMTYKSVA